MVQEGGRRAHHFIFKARKFLNKRKAKMRIQLKENPTAEHLVFGTKVPCNEIVMKLQPTETIYTKSNIKPPGFGSNPI